MAQPYRRIENGQIVYYPNAQSAPPAPSNYPPQGNPQQPIQQGTPVVYNQQAPYQQPAYQQPPPQYVANPGQGMGFTNQSQPIRCPVCQAQTMTRVQHVPGALAWIACCILFCVFWPCSCLPFCIPQCMDTVHYCSNCGSQLGKSGGI